MHILSPPLPIPPKNRLCLCFGNLDFEWPWQMFIYGKPPVNMTELLTSASDSLRMQIAAVHMEVKETIQFYIVFSCLTPAVGHSKKDWKHSEIQREGF